jgi:hypothetical protein
MFVADVECDSIELYSGDVAIHMDCDHELYFVLMWNTTRSSHIFGRHGKAIGM